MIVWLASHSFFSPFWLCMLLALGIRCMVRACLGFLGFLRNEWVGELGVE